VGGSPSVWAVLAAVFDDRIIILFILELVKGRGCLFLGAWRGHGTNGGHEPLGLLRILTKEIFKWNMDYWD